jgi:gliding motility-associated-like protein
MKNFKIILFVLFFLVKFTPVISQIDTVFWFAAPWVTPDHTWKDAVKVHIAGDAGTVVRVRQPAAIAPNKYDTTFTIPASRAFDYTFWRDAAAGSTNLGYDSLESRPANSVRPYGLKISSSDKITVVYDVVTRAPDFLNPETFSLKGQNGMGTEFVCPFQTNWRNRTFTGSTCGANAQDLNCDGVVTQPKQQINIVSTMPGTVVWITPRCPVVGHPANITYSIAMGYGDVYTVENVSQATSTPGQNLSGTIVVSNNPIAVTVTDDSVLTLFNGCFDLIGDQIVPVDVVGDSYIANIGFMYPGSQESIFVVATDNFTQLTINDGTATTYTLNKGDTKQYSIVNPLTSVQADKPVYLWQTSGYGCESGGAILPPLECAGSDTVVFSRNNTQPFLLNVVCKAGNEGNFTIDGNATLLTAADFTVVPGIPGWMGAQKQYNIGTIGIGAHEIRNGTDVFALGIINGDVGTGGLFHYMSTFRRKVNITAGPDFTVCAGATNTVALTGTISGGAITGYWTTPTGTLSAYTSSITTVSGVYTLTPAQLLQPSLTFTLTSTGNCKNVSDVVTLNIVQGPSVSITPSVVTRCKNNLTPITLNGTVTIAPSQNWSGGSGTFFPPTAEITTYTPSPGDAAAGSVTLTLSSIGGCVGANDQVVINFTDPPSVTTPPDINVCTNTPTVAVNGATITGGSSTGVWSTNGGGYFTPSDTTFNTNYVLSASELAAGGVVTLTLTSTNNGLCASVNNTLNINIIPKPIVTAGADYTTCASAVVFTLNGSSTFNSAPTTPTWSAVSGTGAFSNINVTNPTYSMSINDTIQGYVILVISAQGICPNAETDTIRVDILKLPFVNAGINTSVCDNANVLLNGVITGFTGTGQWSSSGTGTFTPSSTNLNTGYTPSGSDILSGSVTFTLASTNNQGCNAVKDTLKISFINSPTANFSFGTACVNSPVVFNDASSGSVATQNWDFGDGTTSIATSPIHTYTLANIYTVTYTVSSANGCMDTITKTVEINSLPVADFIFTNACQNLPAFFQDASTISLGNNIVDWNWNFGDSGIDTINKNPVHTYTASGLYNVNLVVTSDKGCVSSISKPVNVNPKPKAEFGMTNNPTLALETVVFSDFSTPTGSIANWYWNFGDSTSANAQNPTHFYADQGNFNITLTIVDQNGCRDSITKSIEVTLLPLVPTAFSPNKDGFNDFLFVKGGPFEKMKLRVYNSWGEMVFESIDQTIGWDGTWRGQDAPIGVYVWVLDVDMFNNKSVRKTGDVTILR